MTTRLKIAQLLLRFALGIGFLFPVMDRIGWLGTPASGTAAWGNWSNFVSYTNKILPFLPPAGASFMGLIATLAETIFGICLIIGFRTQKAALGAVLLTLIFGLCMAIFLGITAPLKYPVFVFTGASLLLSGLPAYPWSVDNLIKAPSPFSGS
jgi:putative oxidoreductase